MRLILRRLALALVLGALGRESVARADSGDDPFALAADHYSHKRWQQACEAFGKLLAAHPNHARADQARFFYGEALAQLNQLELARAQFAELLARDPNHRYARRALFRSGEAAYLSGDAPAAKRDLQAFRQRYPSDALCGYVLPYLGSLELQAGNAAAAERLFSTALAEFQDGPLADECRLGQARALEQSGQHEAARSRYRTLTEGHGAAAELAAFQLGTMENALGQFDRAVAAFEGVSTNGGDLQDKARLGRAYALYKLGRYEEAEKLLAGLLNHASLRVEAHYWLGLSQKARHEWAAAAQTLTAGGGIAGEHSLAEALAFHAADALLEDTQYAAASDRFDRALARWPRGTWADDCLLGKVRVAIAQGDEVASARLAEELVSKFPDSPLRPLADLAKARSLFAAEKYDQAIEALERIVEQTSLPEQADPKRLNETRIMLTLCQARLGRWDEAQRTLAALTADQPEAPSVVETRLQVAEAAFAAGEFDVAREIFSKLIDPAQSPQVARRGLSGLGWCQFKAQQWEDAAGTFERLVSEHADSPMADEAASMRAGALEHLEQFDAALAMYHLVIERYASSNHVAEALWRAALLHEKLKQPERALELYARLIADHPDFAELEAAVYRRARLLGATDPAAADELLSRLRREFPAGRYAAESALQLAERALEDEQYGRARELLTDITKPDTPGAVLQSAWLLQGRLALAQREWGAVEAPLGKLIERFPEGEAALSAAYLLGEASFRSGDYALAAQRFSDLAAKTSDRPQSWSATAQLRCAQARAQLKEWDKALDLARAMAVRFPNFERQFEVDYLVGRALAAQADFAAAREAYARVIDSPQGGNSETAALAQWMIGESYFHQENYKAAMAEYARLDERHPFPRWQAAALLQAGKCQELTGQWRAAAESYQRLLKVFPGSEFCDEARRRLAAAEQQTAAGTPAMK